MIIAKQMNTSPPKPDQKPWIEWVILLSISLLFILYNYYLLFYTGSILKGDAAEHAYKSVLAFQSLKQFNIPQFCWGDNFYPPLMYQISALEYFFFKPGMISVALSQFPYWAVLIFSLYGIGKRLFSPLTGYLAVFYFLTMPLTVLWSYQYMLDLPASAMLALVFYLLLQSDNFKNGWYSRWCGIVLALGMLTKWWVGYLLLGPILVYLVYLPCAYLKNNGFRLLFFLLLGGLLAIFVKVGYLFKNGLYPMVFQHFWWFILVSVMESLALWLAFYGLFVWAENCGEIVPENRAAMMNFLAAMTLAMLFCGWLYFNPHFALLHGDLFAMGAAGSILPWPSWGYYPAALWITALRGIYLPMFLIGLAVFGFKGLKNFSGKIFWFTLLSSFALLIIMPNKQERYLLPWLVLASPLAVFWFEYLKRFKVIPIIILLAIGLLHAFCFLPPLARVCETRPLPVWLVHGNPSLLNIRENMVIDEPGIRKFLAPLPQKGETVFIFIQNDNPVGDNFIKMPILFWSLNLDLLEQTSMGAYQYVIYSLKTGEPQSRFVQNVKHQREFLEDVVNYDFQVLSRYPFAKHGFDIFLARVRPKRR